MRKMKLEVFTNQCAICKEEFLSLHLSPYEYSIVLFETEDLKTSFLLQDEDPVWDEVSKLVEEIGAQFELSEDEMLSICERVVTKTVDPFGCSHEELFIWGDIPCPRCGAMERSFFGPREPIDFVDVELEKVTHNRWDNTSKEKKRRQVESVIKSFKREGKE
jgi:hypothetical protein